MRRVVENERLEQLSWLVLYVASVYQVGEDAKAPFPASRRRPSVRTEAVSCRHCCIRWNHSFDQSADRQVAEFLRFCWLLWHNLSCWLTFRRRTNLVVPLNAAVVVNVAQVPTAASEVESSVPSLCWDPFHSVSNSF